MVKQLRDKTGAGMMECKAALTEANGNMEEAITLLRKRGLAQAAKRAGRATAQGMIGSYIHMGGKIGVLVEVNCESDFVARTDDFNNLVKEVGMHIAAADPQVGPPRGRAGRGDREGEGDLSRADGEDGQAGARARQDHRGQAWQLLLAVRAARPAVDPRRQRDRRAARRAGQRQDRREHPGQPVRALPGRRRRANSAACEWSGPWCGPGLGVGSTRSRTDHDRRRSRRPSRPI